MVIVSDRLRIQAAISDLLKDQPFPIVTYDENGAPNPIDISVQGSTVLPITPILCNEISTAFAEDENYKRGLKDKRTSWLFELRLRFNREVLSEPFEEDWIGRPLIIPGDNNSKQITLRLQGATYTHPPQKNSPTGSNITFVFEAEQGRR